MQNTLLHTTSKTTFPGAARPLGAAVQHGGVNFAIFSQHAQEVFLLLFDTPDGEPTDVIRIENKTDHIWHVFVQGIKAGQLYGYQVHGEYNPAQGKRFNPHKLLIDPYARAISGKVQNFDDLMFAYDLNAPQKDYAMDQRDNAPLVPKSIVIDDSFDWQGDQPLRIPMNDLIVYETHVKGFTAHSSSEVKHPGTYLGLTEKIPYLKELGINAVELMPVHEFFIRTELVDKGLTDFWGYNPIGFFAPEWSYSTQRHPGCQVNEFKTMVRELHKAGIEVILDVVYNHTGEGNELGPTLCFKGIDNPTYYSLIGNKDNPDEPYRFYLNDTGCGNTFNMEHPAAMSLVLDSLRYWAEVMHVDGFRFDLASILARVQGRFNKGSIFFDAVKNDPVLSQVKMIAEPWDLTTYQVGNFPPGWSEWNGRFRDAARRFLKGDEGQAGEMAKRLTGSSDIYQQDGRHPHNSINFITCHDGFTLRDLYSYNDKHNEANREENRDGAHDNLSWNCGVEGETEHERIIRLRKQMIKNALCCLFFSSGTPMILYGDEVMRTQRGNNNAYCQDNELTWFNWNDVKQHADLLLFCKKAIVLRKTYPILRHPRFLNGEGKGTNQTPELSWFGKCLDEPKWDSPKLKMLCYQLADHEQTSPHGRYQLFMVFNMNHRGSVIKLPKHPGLRWYRVVDTARPSGTDFRPFGKEKILRTLIQYCSSRSVRVFLGKC